VIGHTTEGLTNIGIANRLVISERTVEAHVRHILTKLDIPESGDNRRRALAVLAYLKGVHAWVSEKTSEFAYSKPTASAEEDNE
jgi:DNA-binding CsgD family transcriptional regulator